MINNNMILCMTKLQAAFELIHTEKKKLLQLTLLTHYWQKKAKGFLLDF